ncbi:MAG: hypothetical protein JNN28_02150 [Saprospiraceae bacterium]|nr:hypothetical protein [Saprospiraceae bacterium]
MESLWRGLGGILGGAAGVIVGTIDAIKDGVETLQNGGSLEDAGKAAAEKFEETFEQAVEEGADFGENQLPEIAEVAGKAAAVVLGTIAAATVANKVSAELDKKLNGESTNPVHRKLLYGEDDQSIADKIGKRFTKVVFNRKSYL